MSKRSRDRIEDRLAAIGDEAEAGEEDQMVKPIPADVKVTRGNPRSRVLQVRLNPDEYAAIERIAERRGLPASTVAREELLKLVTEEDAQDQPLVALIAAADRVKALAVDVALADHIMVADNLVISPTKRGKVSESELRRVLGIREQGRETG